MASLDDIATIQKNGVLSVNGLNQTIARYNGTNTSPNYAADAVVVLGPGRLVNISVTVAGTTTGSVYNATTTSSPAAATKLATIPNTVGVFPMNLVFNTGLVVVVGTGQELCLTYSTGA